MTSLIIKKIQINQLHVKSYQTFIKMFKLKINNKSRIKFDHTHGRIIYFYSRKINKMQNYLKNK